MTRFPPWLFALALLAPLSACKKTAGETTPPGDGQGDLEDREVVNNWEAKTGDVAICPISGKKFEVKDDSGRFDYQGYSFVFCCANCLDKVEADPGKYLDALVEEAGGSAAPDPAPDPVEATP